MNEHVKQDLRYLFKELLKAYKSQNAIKIKEISNQTNHNSAIYQNEDFIAAAILFYALSKLVQRAIESKRPLSPLMEKALERAKTLLEEDQITKYRQTIKRLFSLIAKSDSKLKIYTEELIKKAQIYRGNKLYAHGISMRRAAKLMGTDIWALANYVGKTEVPESEMILALDRLKFTRGLFK
jgi:hypothetical protein